MFYKIVSYKRKKEKKGKNIYQLVFYKIVFYKKKKEKEGEKIYQNINKIVFYNWDKEYILSKELGWKRFLNFYFVFVLF